jgi:transcriptional regulator with XRE-family HTH domain
MASPLSAAPPPPVAFGQQGDNAKIRATQCGESQNLHTFKAHLARYKREHDLSISEISRRTGVNRSLVASYLKGANPTAKNRERMADGLLLPGLTTAGFKEHQCEECGATFRADPRHKNRKYCSRKCNLRATATRVAGYNEQYRLARTKHDLEEHQRAVKRFCDWCTGGDAKCPNPVDCPLATVSPYVYDHLQS